MMSLFSSGVAPAASKSLALEKDGVFRLLVLVTALLGWVLALGAGGIVLMQSVYSQWELDRSSTVSVYLMADAPTAKINTLQSELSNRTDVSTVRTLPREEVVALVQPFVGSDENAVNEFPLPVVMRIGVTEKVDYGTLANDIQTPFPNAEIDDARTLLATSSKAVRIGQALVIAVSIVLFIIMAFLVTVIVCTGLRAQEKTLAVLRYIGSTDTFLMRLVVQQVVRRALIGWGIAVLAAALTFTGLIFFWPLLKPYSLTPLLPAVILIAPLLLPFLAQAAAKSATRKILD